MSFDDLREVPVVGLVERPVIFMSALEVINMLLEFDRSKIFSESFEPCWVLYFIAILLQPDQSIQSHIVENRRKSTTLNERIGGVPFDVAESEKDSSTAAISA